MKKFISDRYREIFFLAVLTSKFQGNKPSVTKLCVVFIDFIHQDHQLLYPDALSYVVQGTLYCTRIAEGRAEGRADPIIHSRPQARELDFGYLES